MPIKDTVTQMAEIKENSEPMCEKRQIGPIRMAVRAGGSFSTRLNRTLEFQLAAVPMNE